MEMKVTLSGGRSKVNAEYKGFTIKTDQAVFNDGDNSAPAPFDLFLASLATCAALYVFRFAQQRNMPTDNIYLTLNTEKDRKRRMLSKIKFDVFLPDDFPEKYKKAIINAVNLCAVKKHIHEPPEFETLVHIGDNVVAEDHS